MKKLALLLILFSLIFFTPQQVHASGASIIGPDTIHKQSNAILTMGDIVEMYSSSLGIIQVMEDGYTGKGNILGTHLITLFATNGTDHAYKTISVIVIPELGPVKAVGDSKNIYLRTTQVLAPEQIVRVLEKTGHITITSTTQMMTLTNTYVGNEETPGQYLFEFRLVNSAGVDMVYSSIIRVVADGALFVPDIPIVFTPRRGSVTLSTAFNIAIAVGLIAFFMWFGRVQVQKMRERNL